MSFADELRNTRPRNYEQERLQREINEIVNTVRYKCSCCAESGGRRLTGFPHAAANDDDYATVWSISDLSQRPRLYLTYQIFFGSSAERKAAMARAACKLDARGSKQPISGLCGHCVRTSHNRSNEEYELGCPVFACSFSNRSEASAVRDAVARELGKDGFSTCSVSLLEGHNIKELCHTGFWDHETHYSYAEAPGTFYTLYVDVSW